MELELRCQAIRGFVLSDIFLFSTSTVEIDPI